MRSPSTTAIRSAKTAAERSRKDAGVSGANVNSAIQPPFPAPGLLCAIDVSLSRPARRAWAQAGGEYGFGRHVSENRTQDTPAPSASRFVRTGPAGTP